MGKIRYKVKAKIMPLSNKIVQKFKMIGYKGDAGYDAYLRYKALKVKVDTMQFKIDSLQRKIDSLSTKKPDSIQIQMQAKCKGK